MGLFGFGKASCSPPTVAKDTVAKDTAAKDTAAKGTVIKDVVACYQRLRSTRLHLSNELVARLSRDTLDEGARRLGILRDGTFVFDSEQEMSVLMDYCIYDVDHRGRNTVEQYLCDCPPDPDSDEMLCLQAMQHATYTLAAVVGIEPGVGCHVRNLHTEETRLLADVGLAQTARVGTLMATRLLDFGDFVTTSGAALPVGVLDDDALEEWQRKIRTGVNDDGSDPAPLIRACLEKGTSSRVQYGGANPRRRIDVGTSP